MGEAARGCSGALGRGECRRGQGLVLLREHVAGAAGLVGRGEELGAAARDRAESYGRGDRDSRASRANLNGVDELRLRGPPDRFVAGYWRARHVLDLASTAQASFAEFLLGLRAVASASTEIGLPYDWLRSAQPSELILEPH